MDKCAVMRSKEQVGGKMGRYEVKVRYMVKCAVIRSKE